MKYLYLFIWFLFSIVCQGNNVRIKSTPNWVNSVKLKSDSITSRGGGYQFLMTDYQENISAKTSYYHNMISVFNSEGIQEMSDLTISYDPAYQTLNIHKLQVIRNGEVINKKHLPIQVIQQESGQSKKLYDESLTAIIHFDDIQKNDIIEYSYSLIGYNPIYKNNYSATLTLEYNVPINHIYYRILSANELTYNLLYSASAPQITKGNNGFEYIWNESSLDPITYDTQVPVWYNIQKRVDVSTYKNWKTVTDLLVPLYKYNNKDISNIASEILEHSEIEDTVLAFINFVQDDIRYLGLEAGSSAFKPHNPKFVYEQKYGDCKDKSLLLVALLREIGLDANPVLVNSWKSKTIVKDLPSINVFNHCVVTFDKDDKTYYIDPTISNQGGDLDHIHFPTYDYGLILNKNVNELTPLPESKIHKTKVKEDFTITSFEETSYLDIATEYSGNKADDMRMFYEGISLDVIEKNYVDYYSSIYPNIKMVEPLKIIDFSKNTINKFIVKERYSIDSIWVSSAELENLVKLTTYPLNLYDLIIHTNTANRTQPYALGPRKDYEQVTTYTLPENWPVEPTAEFIYGPGFQYEFESSGSGNKIELKYRYETILDWIPANEVKLFLQKNKEIQDNITYELTYVKGGSSGTSWFTVFLFVITAILSIYFGIQLYIHYNPVVQANDYTMFIGGWLYFPLIGLLLTPVLMAREVFSTEIFNANIWNGLSLITEHTYTYSALLVVESIYNVSMIIFSVVLIILFFQRRTSVPNLMIIFYIATLVFPILDSLAYDLLDNTNSISQFLTPRELGRAFMIVCVWIPYFRVSTRVKDTFGRIIHEGKLVNTGDVYQEEQEIKTE